MKEKTEYREGDVLTGVGQQGNSWYAWLHGHSEMRLVGEQRLNSGQRQRREKWGIKIKRELRKMKRRIKDRLRKRWKRGKIDR